MTSTLSLSFSMMSLTQALLGCDTKDADASTEATSPVDTGTTGTEETGEETGEETPVDTQDTESSSMETGDTEETDTGDTAEPKAPLEDLDGDGFFSGVDCDDGDDEVYPGASEQCDDGADNDCDGCVDCEDAQCESACYEQDCVDGVDDEGGRTCRL